MKNPQPLFDSTTHYRLEVQGRLDVDWLQSFESSAEIDVDVSGQVEDITVLYVHTDQSGVVGLVRSLHGLGITILQLEVVPEGGKPASVEE